MSRVIAETTGAKIVTDEGEELELRWSYDTETTSGLPFLEGRLYVNGEHRATPFRVKASGNRLAADFPACDPEFVVVGEGGQITNG